MKHDLFPLREDPCEKMMFEYFPYIDWLRSKIERRSPGDIFAAAPRKRKAGGRMRRDGILNIEALSYVGHICRLPAVVPNEVRDLTVAGPDS